MGVMPYIVYLDPDTAFGEEVLMYTDNAIPITCGMSVLDGQTAIGLRGDVMDGSVLKRCPFCWGEAQVMHMDLSSLEEGWKVWGVWCVDDLHAEEHGGYQHGHYIENFATEEEAIEAWNTRTPEQAVAVTLGKREPTYEQWRAISEAIGDGMEYAHDKAIEHPDEADPLWNLDEYVNRVIEVAFGDTATPGSGKCSVESRIFIEGEYVPCPYYEYEMECGGQFRWDEAEPPTYCPNCGKAVR